MEISERQAGDLLELKVEGRLDGYWAEHLSSALSQAIRRGFHRLDLDLSGVPYLSSAGIRVLVQAYKQLRAIQGSFAVCSASGPVKSILDLAGLGEMLIRIDVTTAETPVPVKSALGRFEKENSEFEVVDSVASASLKCSVLGDPRLLPECRFRTEDCRRALFPHSTLGVGLGAFGNDFADCRTRFGEFLAVAGAAAYLPTDGTNVPDYMIAAGDFVPEVKLLYGLACEGEFAHVAHFEAKNAASPPALSEIVDGCFEMAQADVLGIAMVAECAGLMGAALRRSPAAGTPDSRPFRPAEIRDWLSFTSERAHSRSLALVVGVATRKGHEALAPFLRPVGDSASSFGHFHAAAFSYRPLRKGDRDLKAIVAALFGEETLQGVLHLLPDRREIVGAGESDFLRGACWVGPISEVSVEGSSR